MTLIKIFGVIAIAVVLIIVWALLGINKPDDTNEKDAHDPY